MTMTKRVKMRTERFVSYLTAIPNLALALADMTLGGDPPAKGKQPAGREAKQPSRQTRQVLTPLIFAKV